MRLPIITLGVLLGIAAAQADAAPITQSFDFAASDFKSTSYMPNYPITKITGTFTISFDNAADVSATKNGLTVTNFSAASYFDLKYTYDKQTDTLTIADNPGDYLCYVSGQYFCFFVSHASTDLSSDGVTANIAYYSAPGNFGLTSYYTSPRTITRLTASVPEPATWGLMLVGFGLAGLSLRRSRRQSSPPSVI